MADGETISISGGLPPAAGPSNDALVLIIAWCADEPQRVGEVAFFPQGQASQTLGRGEGEGEARVRFTRQRPDRITPTEPLQGLALSRRQLEVTPRRAKLEVERLGRRALFLNGASVEKATVGPGDTLLLEGQLLLFCTRRVLSIPRTGYFAEDRSPAFGEVDAAAR